MKATSKERYQQIKDALDNGLSCLAATKKFSASMTTISRVRASKTYDEFLTMGKPEPRKLNVKPVTKKVATEPKATPKAQPKVTRKSPWDKLKSFFGF